MIQHTLDTYMIDEGIARYRKGVEDKRTRENESATGYGQRLLSYAIIPFAELVSKWLTDTAKTKATSRGSLYPYLNQLAPDVVAFLTTQAVLDNISMSKAYAASCLHVGKQLENEARFTWLKKHQPNLFKKLERQLERCHSADHKATVIIHTMNKAGVKDKEGEPFKPWGKATRLSLGVLVIDLMEKSTGLVQTPVVGSGKNKQRLIQATEKTMEWIASYNGTAELLEPVWLPMVEKPAPWHGSLGGGYATPGIMPLPLVKRALDSYLENQVEGAQMPDVYASINALQDTPWKVNTRVHGIMQHAWDVGRQIGGLPSSVDDELPPKPADISTNKEVLNEWKIKASRVHASNAALRSNRLHARKLLNLAQKFGNVEKFYLPYQLDFRGRVYTVPSFLSPQGSDLSRALLLFADGVPIRNDEDAYWLQIYGANLYGKDKITFEGRLAWVASQRQAILDVAKDPLANQWWQTADEPWQFLAWCFEWAGWLTEGPGFLTHLPVCLDGTNNGLQILSMLTRDELAAKATNVLPSETPADIYGDVAKRVVELLKHAVETHNEHAEVAAEWLAFGIDRKTTKRPVMVLPYGGTFHSCRDYVHQWYKETAKARNIELPSNIVVGVRCHYLSELIWEAISFCVGRPRLAMAWLQECATLMTEAGLPIEWVAPSGFPVLQAYKDVRSFQVRTILGNCIRKVRIAEDHATKLSKSRQKNGIAPNFVHSLDASALVKTVVLCVAQNITSFAMIHDSYGTHAPRMHEMAAALRVAFVHIFTDDWLNNLRNQLQQQLDTAMAKDKEGNPIVLPSVPPFGDLDVRSLFQSEFFFA